ncbi:B-block_TFIIIC domain-containing protein [Pseudozyma hubeiensis]|nr:B-block_TFIIIC domain-containing protein [Pseudozyma hubeiensis]
MIDELIHHCIEQIGLDGEAGTDVDRFADYVRQFHIDHSSRSHSPDQLIDASYLAFVFRQVLGHPDVSVGLFVAGVPAKSGARGGITRKPSAALDSPVSTPQKAENNSAYSSEYDTVNVLPDKALAEQQGLENLQQLHADRLRLVLHTDLIQRLLVGTDAIYLPPSSYRVLQIVCRSREQPVLSTDIGTAIHTDQKTVFYICKRLIELNLITKFQARETGTTASYFVATRFEHRCDILVRQRNADIAADLHVSAGVPAQSSVKPSSSNPVSTSFVSLGQPADDDVEDEAEAEDDDVAPALTAPTVTIKEEESQHLDSAATSAIPLAPTSTPIFEHLDADKSLLWMRSRPELVRFRIYLVCNSTSSKVTARLHLLRRINLTSTGQPRKSFIALLEHAVVDHFLELVNVYVSSTGRTHRGLRMTPKGRAEMYEMLSGEYGDAATIQHQAKAARLNEKLQQDLSRVDPALPRELTLERHVHEQVARAGPAGRTIRQLMTQLHATGHFARALDQIVQRAEDADGEPALSDLRIRSFHEHKVRVRSTKIYSHHAWVLQSANDGILDPDHVQLLAQAGGSTTYHLKSSAYDALAQVDRHLHTLSNDLFTPTPRKGAHRIGRPPKKRSLDDDDDQDTPPRKRGRPRKHPLPDLATSDIPKKRGRPRKDQTDSADSAEASPAVTETSQSAGPSTSRPRKATRKQDAAQDVSPPARTSPRSGSKAYSSDLMDDEYMPAVPDSPTAGVATRRSRRIVQTREQTRPSSLLASSSVTAMMNEDESSQVDQAFDSKPAPTTPAASSATNNQATTQPDVSAADQQSPKLSEVAPPSAVDVSNISDLMPAASQFKSEAPFVVPTTPAAKKQRDDATAARTASGRKSRASVKQRTNLTQLRSSLALVECIRDAGGAMDVLQIPDLLSDYVERHGFTSDAQLSDLRDRKVREKALAAAVDNNVLRRTFIRLDLPTAQFPRRQIVYLPEMPADQLQTYCESVKQGHSGWLGSKDAKTALTNPTNTVAVDSQDASRFAKPWHVRDPLPLAELPKDDSQLFNLRQFFRDVTSVSRQHLGFLGGELMRLKAFHLACAKFIAARTQPSSGVEGARSLPLSFFWTEAPLDLFLALVPTAVMDESAERELLDPQVRLTPIHALSGQLKARLGLTGRFSEAVSISVYSLATQLSQLGIVQLHAANAANGQHGSKLDVATTSVEPRRYLAVYDWTSEQELKPLIGSVNAGLDADQINRFWAKMQTICLKTARATNAEGAPSRDTADPASGLEADGVSEMERFKKVPEELSSVLFSDKAWRPFHQLRPSQVKFLYRMAVQDIPSVTQVELDRLTYVTLAPQQVVRAVLQKRFEQAKGREDPHSPVQQPKLRFTWPLKLGTISLPTDVYRSMEAEAVAKAAAAAGEKRRKTQVQRERDGRMTTLNKARQLRERREQEFELMLQQAFGDASAAQNLRAKIETALEVIRRRFVAGDVGFDASAVQAAISRTIRSASGVRLMPAVRAPARDRTQSQRKRSGPERTKDLRTEGEPSQQVSEGADAATGKGTKKRDRRSRRNPDLGHFWTPARKELLRDAAVILRVRDRVRGRSDWSALFQVIDREEQQQTRGVIMAQWRSQYYRMQSLYGEEAYLAALESRWIQVYLSARESGTLQEDDFPAASGFDLVAQIQLLRDEIDKNEVQRSLAKPIARHNLPLRLDTSTDFTRAWEEEFVQDPIERRFEGFFASGEMGVTTKRREALLYAPLGEEDTHEGEAEGGAEAADAMAEWAVRVVIASSDANAHDVQATPSAVDEMTKAEFCRGVGDVRIEEAMQRLIDAKLIRSISTDPAVRRRPGTNFVFTEELQKLLPDQTASTRLAAADLQAILKHRKEAFQMICDEGDGVVVEPVEADGEAAALVPLLESGLMSGEVDVRAFEALRQGAAFNARVLNDDDLEALISVKGGAGMMELLDAAVAALPAVPDDEVLGWLTDESLVGREAELDAVWRQRFEDVVGERSDASEAEARRLQGVGLDLIRAGPRGLSLEDREYELSREDVETLTSGHLPLAFFSPLTSHPVLVASLFVRDYVFTIPSRTTTAKLVVPHVWTTLTHPAVNQWRWLLDTLVAYVLQRPAVELGLLARRFCAKVEEREVVGVAFADVWSAVKCLREQGVVEVKVGEGGGGMGRWTLHPGRRVWAGFE